MNRRESNPYPVKLNVGHLDNSTIDSLALTVSSLVILSTATCASQAVPITCSYYLAYKIETLDRATFPPYWPGHLTRLAVMGESSTYCSPVLSFVA